MSGVIYFLQAGEDGPFKIGYTSRRSEVRRQACQTYNHQPIRIAAECAGDKHLEERTHAYLAAHHLSGEWYANHQDVREVVSAIESGVTLRSIIDMAL